MKNKEILFLISGLVVGILVAIAFSGGLATVGTNSGYNILIDSSSGEILSAGFTDFSTQVTANLEEIKGLGDSMPDKITTDYYYDKISGKVIKRDVPIKPKAERDINAVKDNLKQQYLNLKTPEDKADFIARYLKIID